MEAGLDQLGLQLALDASTAPPSDLVEEQGTQPIAAQQQRPQQQYQPQQQQYQPQQPKHQKQPYQQTQQPYQQTQQQQVPQHQQQVARTIAAAPTPAPAPPPAAAPPAPQVVDKKGKKAQAAAQKQEESPPAQVELTWDLEGEVPTVFKAFRGKKWREMLDVKGMKYISWATGNFKGPQQQDAIGFASYVASKGGPNAVLASLE